jgi:hypothetical protein
MKVNLAKEVIQYLKEKNKQVITVNLVIGGSS